MFPTIASWSTQQKKLEVTTLVFEEMPIYLYGEVQP